MQQWHFLPCCFTLFHAFPLGNPLYLWYFTTTPRAVLRIRLGIVSEIRETQPPKALPQTAAAHGGYLAWHAGPRGHGKAG